MVDVDTGGLEANDAPIIWSTFTT